MTEKKQLLKNHQKEINLLYDQSKKNDVEFIENLVAYAEAKDDCSIDDADWKDAIKQGKIKSKKLKLPYFIVTNGKTSIFYNTKT